MDDVLQTDHLASQVLLHLSIGLDLNALLPHLTEELLVDQLTDQFLRGLTPSNVVLDATELANVGRSAPDKYGCIDTSEAELIEDDFLLLGNIRHTPDTHHKKQLSNASQVSRGYSLRHFLGVLIL